MADYYSKFNGNEIDEAVENVLNRVNKIYPSNSFDGDKLVISSAVYNAINSINKIYVHEFDGGGFHLWVYSDCPYNGCLTLNSFFGTLDEAYPYSIFRIYGYTLDHDHILGIVPYGDCSYSSPSFICVDDSEGTFHLRSLDDSIFEGQITHIVSSYSKIIN